jgi:uroporphyrinogen-III synthase
MNSDSLAGLTVLITRPSTQQQTLQRAIEEKGGAVLSLPLIEITPLTEPIARQELKDKVLGLDNYQALIFVSSNAVKFGGELINDYWPQFPLGIDVIAVGPTTAEATRKLLACEVIQPSSGMTSEDILRLPQLQDVKEKKIGIVRGRGGRELLATTLKERGALVDYLEAYSRKVISYDNKDFCDRVKAAGVKVLTVNSGESLDRLISLLADNKEIIEQLVLLVPSERVALQAKNAGFSKIKNAKGADPVSFVLALGELGADRE